MSEYDRMLKNKRGAGGAIVIIGLILGFLAFILDLLFIGEINLGQTPLLLMLGGLAIAALGAAYIGAGTATAVKKLSRQIKLMKNEINQKDKVILEQQETLESLSDTRLTGLSETVDKMEFLAKSRTLTELPKKSEGQQALPDIGPKPKEEPKPILPPSKWDKKASEKEKIPPPPPKPMVAPKGDIPKDLPPPPSMMPLKPEEKPKEEKPEPEAKDDELIEDEKKEMKKGEVTMGSDGVPLMICPTCSQTIRGKWKECPFCDEEIDMGLDEEEKKEEPSPEDPETKDIISSVLDEVMSMTPSVADETHPPKLDEEEEDEEEAEDEKEIEDEEEEEKEEKVEDKVPEVKEDEAILDKQDTEEDREEEEPVEDEPATEPETPSSEPPMKPLVAPGTHSTDKDACPQCGKTIKPHWRNCPYCKFVLKPG